MHSLRSVMEAAADCLAAAFDPDGALRPYPSLQISSWKESRIPGTQRLVQEGACHFPKPHSKSWEGHLALHGAGDSRVPVNIDEDRDLSNHSKATRDLYILKQIIEPQQVADIHSVAAATIYDSNRLEPVDSRPACMSAVVQRGRWVCDDALRNLLQPIIDSQILPYARNRYAAPEAVVCTAFLRRFAAPSSPRANLQAHFDGNALVTVNIGLSEPSEFVGGMYVQPTAEASSRLHVPLGCGDVLFHSYDLLHGVSVASGLRHSLILWLRDSQEACEMDTCLWYVRDASKSDPDAELNLAEHYRAGTGGFPKDNSKSFEMFQRSAMQGHPIAQFKLGMTCEIEGDMIGAVTWWRHAAGQGYAKAQRRLAEHEETSRWLRAAADQDDPLAMYELHRSLSSGSLPAISGEVSANTEALQWLVRAARHGHASAQFELGSRVFGIVADEDVTQIIDSEASPTKGRVSKLLVAALGWLGRSAEGGDLRAQNLFAAMRIFRFQGREDLELALLAFAHLLAGQQPHPSIGLHNVAWAAGASCCTPALRYVIHSLQHDSEEFSQALVHAAWACVRCEVEEESDMKRLLVECIEAVAESCMQCRGIHAMQFESSIHLAALLWSLASLRAHIPKAMSVLLPMICSMLDLLSTEDLAKTVWATSTLVSLSPMQQSEPLYKDMNSLSEAVCSRVDEFSPEHLANATWALATFPSVISSDAAKLFGCACANLEHFTPNEVTNLSWAFSRLSPSHIFPPTTDEVLVPYIAGESCVFSMAWSDSLSKAREVVEELLSQPFKELRAPVRSSSQSRMIVSDVAQEAVAAAG